MKRLFTFILASFLIVSIPGCHFFESASDPSTVTYKIADVVYNGLSLALGVLDVKVAEHLDSIPNPTDEDIALAEEQGDRIERARQALELAHAYVLENKGSEADFKSAVYDAASSLKLVAEELKSQNVTVPKVVLEALDLALSFSKSG